MKRSALHSPKLNFLYSLLFFQLFIYTLHRLFFLYYFKENIEPGTSGIIIQSLWLGLRFDLRFASGLLIPAILLINLPLNPQFKIKALNVVYSLFFGIINLLYILDLGYFSYLKSRLNATVIEFIKNPLISLNMLVETYPVFWITLAFLFLTILYCLFLSKYLTPNLSNPTDFGSTKTKISGALVFTSIFSFGLYGSFQMYPLRWSEAYSSPNTFASNLSLNPILFVGDTYTFRTAEFEKEKAREHYDLVASYLGVDTPSKELLNFTRTFKGDPNKYTNRPNIVVIVMESLAWYKTGIGGSEVNPTPYLDQLAKESLSFDHFYTPTVATARSIFAAITSLPDTSKVKTGSRNPFIVNQHTIMGEFKDYEKFYLLGGSANWGNIRGVLSYNIPSLNIYEEGSYQSPRVDVWGISDLNLFKESKQKISHFANQNKKPFFAFLQTSGFHRPYTIPQNSDEFKTKLAKDISESQIKKYGFESFEEYNAMRLQDFSLGKFMELAKKESWYSNTIFVIFGDHALPHNNATNVPDWKKSLANSYHVPLLIHYPAKINPAVESKIASELDVMPTLAGLAGIPYRTRGLGRDLFNANYDGNRFAFSYNWYAPFNLSLIDKDFYFEYIPYNGQGKLIKYSESQLDLNVKEKYPEKYLEMEKLTKGLYESARYILHNNPRMY